MARLTKKQLWKKHIAEGVTKLTDEVVKKLCEAFAIDATISQACDYADISEKTYYNWIEKNPELLQKFDRMRQRLPLKAKQNIAGTISAGDIGISKWLLERKEASNYGEKVKVEHSGSIANEDVEGRADAERVREEYEQKLKDTLKSRPKV